MNIGFKVMYADVIHVATDVNKVDGRYPFFHSPSSCRAGSPDILTGGTKKGERKGTPQPRHGPAMIFCCNHRGNPLVADSGYLKGIGYIKYTRAEGGRISTALHSSEFKCR